MLPTAPTYRAHCSWSIAETQVCDSTYHYEVLRLTDAEAMRTMNRYEVGSVAGQQLLRAAILP